MNVYPNLGQNQTIPLYPEGEIPYSKPNNQKEETELSDVLRVSKVQIPNIAVFLPAPKNATGEAILICPGGGYRILSYDSEGCDIAKYWNAKGIAAFVLKSRLPEPDSQTETHLCPITDAKRALRLIRHQAKDWKIDPQRIGVMGFSAGGHLAATLSTQFDEGNAQANDPVETQSSRPDFTILVYPVVSFVEDCTHTGSRDALVGSSVAKALFLSPEKQIQPNTPPAILVHSSDDLNVPSENSLLYYQALLRANISAALHIYPGGGHGYGLATGQGALASWPDRCAEWLYDLHQ